MDACYRTLTASGRGAIAVVRVTGPDAAEVGDAVFRPHRGRSLRQTGPGRLRLGRAGVGHGDEVVAGWVDRETATLEFQCHGGDLAVAAVARALEQAGAAPEPVDSRPGVGRVRLQALEDLSAAPSLRCAEILLDQANGALDCSVEALIGVARNAGSTERLSPLAAEIETLIRRAGVGTRLLAGWKVAIAGRPNVGKSRLFNAIAGFERSIVNPRAGVTRDLVTIRAAFGGWPVELSDTAGERETEDDVEQLGIDRARRARRDSDLFLLVIDRAQPLTEEDRHLLADAGPAWLVANKCDLPPAWEPAELGPSDKPVFTVSAESGEGIEPLIAAMAARIVPDPPPPGAAVPFRPEHLASLGEARECLHQGDLVGFVRSLGRMVR